MVVLELFPNDLDEIEFGAIRRQVNQECTVVNQPATSDFVRNVVVNVGLIRNDQRQTLIALANDSVEKVDHPFEIDGIGTDARVQLVRPEIQCSKHGSGAALGGRLMNGFHRFGNARQAQSFATGYRIYGFQPSDGQTRWAPTDVSARQPDYAAIPAPMSLVVDDLRGDPQSVGNLVRRFVLPQTQLSRRTASDILVPMVLRQLFQRHRFGTIDCQCAFRIGHGHQQTPQLGSLMAHSSPS